MKGTAEGAGGQISSLLVRSLRSPGRAAETHLDAIAHCRSRKRATASATSCVLRAVCMVSPAMHPVTNRLADARFLAGV